MKKGIVCIAMAMLGYFGQAQEYNMFQNQMQPYNKWSFGGGVGLSFGNQITSINLAPMAVYKFSEQFSAGGSVQYNYLRRANYSTHHIYGVGVIGLYNVIPELQISAELEQLRVNSHYDGIGNDAFWNTSLFVGGGYRMGNVAVGVRYNLLYDKNNTIYTSAWQPFVRVMF